jgi:hypothetical protein
MTKRKPKGALWGLLVSLALIPLSGAAAPDAPPVAGSRCAKLLREAAPGELWIGSFSGGRKDQDENTENDEDESGEEDAFNSNSMEIHKEQACFRQKADCERWIYRLKSTYPEEPRRNECMEYKRQARQPRR